jgi:hypothetical protein
MFVSHFPKFFEIERSKSSNTSTAVVLEDGCILEEFVKSSPKEFHLAETFKMKLNNGREMKVVFREDNLIRALYTDSSFYSIVGPEFCLVFDVMYAKTGTEAVAESFYRVVEKQEIDGGQSQSVLSMRAKVDWCFPQAINCESTLPDVASLYIKGNKDLGLKKHHVPVYQDKTLNEWFWLKFICA